MKKFSTKPKIISVKDVNRVIIKVIFISDYKKGISCMNKLMNRLLLIYNKKYNSRELKLKKNDLSIIDLFVDTNIIVNKIINIYTLVLPKKGIIDNVNYEECIKLFKDILYNPDIKYNKFNEDIFNVEKDYLIKNASKYPSSIYDYINEEIIKFLKEDKDVFVTNEEYLNNLSKLNSKDVYNYYLNTIKNNNFISYIYGNIDNEIIDVFNKYFKQDKKELSYNLKYIDYFKIKDFKEKKLTTPYNQSCLCLLYQFNNLKKEDRNILSMFYYFLNSRENSLIYNNLRVKHNLIYNLNINLNNEFGFIGIRVFINKKDLELTKKIITKTINDIKIKSNFELYKKRLLKALICDVYKDEDNIFSKVFNDFNKKLFNSIDVKKQYKIIDKITFNDMKKFINRIVLTKVLLIEGEYDD